MGPVDQERVRASFATMAAMPEVAAALFYERLFTVNPGFRPLFKQDMRIQGVKLMAMLDFIIYNLHQRDETLSAIQELSRRNVEYGVKLAARAPRLPSATLIEGPDLAEGVAGTLNAGVAK